MHQQWQEFSREESEHLLEKCSEGRLGLCYDGEPYVVPVAYKYYQGRIYFHSFKQGRKVDLIKKNSRVCFEVDESHDVYWASVMCYGNIELHDDVDSKRECFKLLTGMVMDDARLARVDVYVGIIDVQEMTGRSGHAPHM
ncbi:MAG: pyridoxamine 5'-phosphate oxidase family protein [Chloroflexota bacterium]|nr:pyridoxamine 5'-phosphate oxidase family protein [Chloroflexota bacterium]